MIVDASVAVKCFSMNLIAAEPFHQPYKLLVHSELICASRPLALITKRARMGYIAPEDAADRWSNGAPPSESRCLRC